MKFEMLDGGRRWLARAASEAFDRTSAKREVGDYGFCVTLITLLWIRLWEPWQAMISYVALSLQGRIFMTHPTKAIFNTLLKDFVKVSKGSHDGQLYSEADVTESMKRIEVVDFHQTIDVAGMKVRCTLVAPNLALLAMRWLLVL